MQNPIDLFSYYWSKAHDQILLQRIKFNREEISNTHFSPFFIVSSGRSGTTLLRRILMQNPDVHIPPESDDNLFELIQLYYSKRDIWSWGRLSRESLLLYQNTRCFAHWNIDLFKECSELINKVQDERRLFTIINYIYSRHMERYKPTAKIWGDKTPYLIFKLNWIKAAIPNARFIHIYRDGRDVVNSRMKVFNEDLVTATNRWIWAIDCIEKFKRNNYVYDISFEEMTKKPDKTIRNLCAFLEVDYYNEMLTDNSFELGDVAMRHHQNMRGEISTKYIRKWESDMLIENVQYVEENAAKQLKLYEYL